MVKVVSPHGQGFLPSEAIQSSVPSFSGSAPRQSPVPQSTTGVADIAQSGKKIFDLYNFSSDVVNLGVSGALGNVSGFQFGLGGYGGIPHGGFAAATGVPAAPVAGTTAAGVSSIASNAGAVALAGKPASLAAAGSGASAAGAAGMSAAMVAALPATIFAALAAPAFFGPKTKLSEAHQKGTFLGGEFVSGDLAHKGFSVTNSSAYRNQDAAKEAGISTGMFGSIEGMFAPRDPNRATDLFSTYVSPIAESLKASGQNLEGMQLGAGYTAGDFAAPAWDLVVQMVDQQATDPNHRFALLQQIQSNTKNLNPALPEAGFFSVQVGDEEKRFYFLADKYEQALEGTGIENTMSPEIIADTLGQSLTQQQQQQQIPTQGDIKGLVNSQSAVKMDGGVPQLNTQTSFRDAVKGQKNSTQNFLRTITVGNRNGGR